MNAEELRDQFRKKYPQWKEFIETPMWKDAVEAATAGMNCFLIRNHSRADRLAFGGLILSEQDGAIAFEQALNALGRTFDFTPLTPEYPDPASEADDEAKAKKKKQPKGK